MLNINYEKLLAAYMARLPADEREILQSSIDVSQEFAKSQGRLELTAEQIVNSCLNIDEIVAMKTGGCRLSR